MKPWDWVGGRSEVSVVWLRGESTVKSMDSARKGQNPGNAVGSDPARSCNPVRTLQRRGPTDGTECPQSRGADGSDGSEPLGLWSPVP